MAKMRAIIAAVLAGAAVTLVLCAFLQATLFPLPDRYVSIHPSQPLEPLHGFAPDSVFNVGTADDLDLLPGIGEVLSQRIIDYRELWGEYRLPVDLLLVKGIGEKTLQKMMQALDEALIPLE